MATLATEFPTICIKSSINIRTNPPKKLMPAANFLFSDLNSSSSLRIRRSFQAQSFNSNGEDSKLTIISSSYKEDLNYILKLAAGTFAGAAAIKYGSALFPGITQPDISHALIMIFAPVMVVIVILVKKSRVEQ